jgi:hypothetical protein
MKAHVFLMIRAAPVGWIYSSSAPSYLTYLTISRTFEIRLKETLAAVEYDGCRSFSLSLFELHCYPGMVTNPTHGTSVELTTLEPLHVTDAGDLGLSSRQVTGTDRKVWSR